MFLLFVPVGFTNCVPNYIQNQFCYSNCYNISELQFTENSFRVFPVDIYFSK